MDSAQSYNAAMDDCRLIQTATWERLVKSLLRSAMMRRGVADEALAQRSAKGDITNYTQKLRNKVAPGRFRAPFFVPCMVGPGAELLQIPKAENVAGEAAAEHGAQALAQGKRS